MAKKKKRTKPNKNTSSPIGKRLGNQLIEIDSLVDKNKYNEALLVLEGLSIQDKKRYEVIERFCDVYHLLGDHSNSQKYAEELTKIASNEPYVWIKLAQAAVYNERQLQALHAAQRFLRRWPDHPAAPDAEKIVDMVENYFLPEMVSNFGLPLETVMKIGELHEKSRTFLERGQFRKAKKELETLVKQYPNFAAGYNNLATVYWQLGDISAAIEAEEKVLSFEPKNLHALANLAHWSLLTGDEQLARAYANDMLQTDEFATDPLYKKIEVLAILGDDEEIISFEKEIRKETDFNTVLKGRLLHLLAVSFARLGRVRKARNLWKKALEVAPYLDIAQENLDDLASPIEMRDGPTPFELGYWIPMGVFTRFLNHIGKAKEDQLQKIIDQLYEQLPGLDLIIARMLERGGYDGREFAVNMIHMCETPGLLEIYKNFAFGRDGPDEYRFGAVNFLKENGYLEEENATLWLQGEWREVQLLGFRISFEPSDPLKNPKAQKMLEEAFYLLHDGEGEEAEKLLVKALELEPDNPSIRNNLAVAYQQQGRIDEAQKISKEIFAQFPDYSFGRMTIARAALKEKDFERVQELIDPIMRKPELHITEFTTLVKLQIDFALAQKDQKAAEYWLEMWEAADPEDEDIIMYTLRVKPKAYQEIFKKMMASAKLDELFADMDE